MKQNLYAIQGTLKDHNSNILYIEYSHRTNKIYYNFINGARVIMECFDPRGYFQILTYNDLYYKSISYKESKQIKPS